MVYRLCVTRFLPSYFNLCAAVPLPASFNFATTL